MIIDGKKIAENILEKLKSEPKPNKFLAVVLVGDDAASENFIKRKKEFAEKLDIDFRFYRLSSELKNDGLRKEVGKIANHRTCGGIVVQLPLPSYVNPAYVLNAIPAEKDIDVLGRRAVEKFAAGGEITPPSVGAFKEIMDWQNIDISAKKVAVLGLGALIGKPISIWLSGKAKELILLDKGSDFAELKKADVVVLGTGQPKLISGKDLKKGAVIIDFGTSFKDGKLSGDLGDVPDDMTYTPTPGGTGPVLVAKLFENFFKLNKE